MVHDLTIIARNYKIGARRLRQQAKAIGRTVTSVKLMGIRPGSSMKVYIAKTRRRR